jgi:hypothetical protein
MNIERALPEEFVEPLRCVLVQMGMAGTRVVGRSSGKQSTCFILEEQTGYERLVLKAMWPTRPNNSPDGVEHEYQALELFHRSTRAYGDIGAPEPLGLFKEQLGYLMSYVDAPNVATLLEANPPSDGDIRTIAVRIVRALELYYKSVGEMYGDFQPTNLLVRPSLQVVLIDPTNYTPVQQLIGEDAGYAPMSADLGHWAYTVAAVSVKQILKGSKLPARMYKLTSEIIAYASRVCAENDTDGFVDAVYKVARCYLVEMKSQRQLKNKALGPLVERRIRALEAQTHQTVVKRRSGLDYSYTPH